MLRPIIRKKERLGSLTDLVEDYAAMAGFIEQPYKRAKTLIHRIVDSFTFFLKGGEEAREYFGLYIRMRQFNLY